MAVIVQKYGGSSVADVDKLRYVAQRVMQTQQQGHQVVVVVSAMGDTTDELLAMAKKVSANPDRRELDMLLSAGERISMALLSMAIRELGGDAISFTGSQSGIITNDRHVDARIIEVRPFRVQDELARGKIVVIAGYQGVSYRKEVTTLGPRRQRHDRGRDGGGARRRILRNLLGRGRRLLRRPARRVRPRGASACSSYEETQEMAEAGAKVLNAQAVEFAKEKGIAIYARATRGPLPGVDPSADGTVVRRNPPRMPGTVVGVASERDVIVLESDAAAGDVLALLDERHVAGKQLHVFADRTTVVISRENLHDEDRLRDLLQTRLSGQARLVDGLAAVSVVGAGINATYANVLAGAAALGRARDPARRNRDVVVPDYVDGSAREDGGGRLVRCTNGSSTRRNSYRKAFCRRRPAPSGAARAAAARCATSTVPGAPEPKGSGSGSTASARRIGRRADADLRAGTRRDTRMEWRRWQPCRGWCRAHGDRPADTAGRNRRPCRPGRGRRRWHSHESWRARTGRAASRSGRCFPALREAHASRGSPPRFRRAKSGCAADGGGGG